MGLRRMLRRRNCLVFCFLATVFFGGFFISHLEDYRHHHRDQSDYEPKSVDREGVDDKKLAALRTNGSKDPYKALEAVANAVEPYTVPSELDYETMTDILPHMWKNAVESRLPNSCEFITFDHNPNMNLGESMFIYASLFGVARKTKRVPFIDHKLGFPLTQIFQFKFMPTAGVSVDGSFAKHRESYGCCRYDDSFLNISCNRKTILSGFLQNPRYFHEYSNELLSTEFIFQHNVGNTCVRKFNEVLSKSQIRRSTCQLVGVHILHPDEMTSRQKERGHVGASADYLTRAFDFFGRKLSEYPCLAFLVAGNEGARNKDLVPDMSNASDPNHQIVKTVFLQGNSEAVRLCMLTQCQHTIMTTGPTGWWVAYLTQQRTKGHVVYQSKYAESNSELMQGLDRGTYFLPSWIGM